MPFGTPGGDMQPQAMLQVFLNVTVFDMDAQAAIEAPRFANYSFPGSFEPHKYYPGRLYLEGRITAATGDVLKQLGHKVHWWDITPGSPARRAPLSSIKRPASCMAAPIRERPAYMLGW